MVGIGHECLSIRKYPSQLQVTYRVTASLVEDPEAVQIARRRAGRFILATNVLGAEIFPNDEVLRECKGLPDASTGYLDSSEVPTISQLNSILSKFLQPVLVSQKGRKEVHFQVSGLADYIPMNTVKQ